MAALDVVSLAEAKLWLKVDGDLTADDALITGLISSAIDMFEQTARRVILSTAKTLKVTCWPNCKVIRLPAGPVVSVDSITCRTATGTTTVSASDYVTQIGQHETDPRVQFKPTAALPVPDGMPGAIIVTYTCETTPLPPMIKTALMSLIAHWYETRTVAPRDVGGEVAFSFGAVCDRYRWASR